MDEVRGAQRARAALAADVRLEDVLALDDVLDQLEPRQRQIVEYRFFGGMTEEEIAEVMGISSRTVQREWVKARAWLYSAMYTEE